MSLQKYLRPKNYAYAARVLMSRLRGPQTGRTRGVRPVFWTGAGACGFFRAYDLLLSSGKTSVYFKSRTKLQNHNLHLHPERELLWERGENEDARVHAYFKHEGVYDHHVAPHSIRYAKEILSYFKQDAVFLCLRSQKSARALWLQWGYRNPLITDRTRKNRYPVEFYPDLSSVARDGRDAVERYIAAYYDLAEELAAAHPNTFVIVDSDRFFSDETYFNAVNEQFGLGLTFKAQTLDCETEVVTTTLDGGLGNNLFQMAEPVAFCAEHGLPPPRFSTWQMPDFPPAYRADRFLGGHTGSQEVLASTFSSIHWLLPSPASFDHKFMLNDMYAFADVHHMREAILRYFEPSAELKRQLLEKYPALSGEHTVSLHHRAGWLTVDTHTFKPFGDAWFEKVLTTHFPEGYDVFVFSDKLPAAQERIEKARGYTNNRYHLVDEGVFPSIVMMSMCKNHILSNSTLSFWGAYLDQEQPRSKTILHPSFETYHSEPHIECRMIPYPEWMRI
jgi:hypothetical protein